MQTRKLYYENCHICEFSGVVLECRRAEKGWQVVLDATAFYPEGGGQACDLGSLNDARVLDVREDGEKVVHLCDRELPVGTAVSGRIDWQRRFDLMQQHTGEHMVSGIIHALYGAHNVGFHMGGELITIDFDVPIPAQALPEIERLANEAVFRNLPVKCWYPSAESLPGVTYRSKQALAYPVRIVEVPGVDSCACCGVHVAATGEVGIIKLFSCVKFHQGVRIEMACGARALDLLNRAYEQNRQVSQAFSAKLMETGAAAQRMNEQLAAEKFRTTALQRQLFAVTARDYAGQGDAVHFAEGLEPALVRELAEAIAQSCGGTAAVFSGSDDRGYSLCLVNKSSDISQLGAQLRQTLGAKGGGKPGFFQGSVPATQEQLRAFFAKK